MGAPLAIVGKPELSRVARSSRFAQLDQRVMFDQLPDPRLMPQHFLSKCRLADFYSLLGRAAATFGKLSI